MRRRLSGAPAVPFLKSYIVFNVEQIAGLSRTLLCEAGRETARAAADRACRTNFSRRRRPTSATAAHGPSIRRRGISSRGAAPFLERGGLLRHARAESGYCALSGLQTGSIMLQMRSKRCKVRGHRAIAPFSGVSRIVLTGTLRG